MIFSMSRFLSMHQIGKSHTGRLKTSQKHQSIESTQLSQTINTTNTLTELPLFEMTNTEHEVIIQTSADEGSRPVESLTMN